MSDVYSHSIHKFADAGLQLRLPIDAIPANEYAKLTNALALLEGQLVTRPGFGPALVMTTTGLPVHTIHRLNQRVTSIVGDRIVGSDTRLFTQALQSGASPIERTDVSFSGNPLSIVDFRFFGDTAAWAIIADRNGMRKYRGGSGTGYYQKLGLTPPTSVATATAGGAGLLNATGGAPYDWRYTYVNEVTLSESNPSPASFSVGSGEIKRPTLSITPDPSFGGNVFANPDNAWDANLATAATGTASSGAQNRQSVKWVGFPAGSFAQALQLNVLADTTVTGTGGTVFATIYYTLDSGTSWKTIFSTSITLAQKNYIAILPPNTLLQNIQVRAVVHGVGPRVYTGGGAIPQHIIARQIREVAGDFPSIGPFQGSAGGTRTITLNVYDISTSSILTGGVVTQLNLVNQSANVVVAQTPDTQVTAGRLYRRGGSLTSTWFFSQQFPLTPGSGNVTVNDNVPDTQLGTAVPTGAVTLDGSPIADYAPPVSSVNALERPLPCIWGPFDERVLGTGDPDRPEAVYFSNRSNADQWPAANWVNVSDPSHAMMNGCVYNTRSFAFSTDRMYELVPNIPGGATLTPFTTPCARGLIGRWGIVSTGKAVFFVAKDGVYATTGGAEQSLIENNIKPIFPTKDAPGQMVSGIDAVDMTFPEDIRLEYHNDELWLTYRGATTGLLQQLVFDQLKNRWRAALYTPAMQTVYSEPGTTSSFLLGGTDGNVYQIGGPL